jgi:predicted DNA-binding protein (UPF0251 family)
MTKPKKIRIIDGIPICSVFKPQGIPASGLQEIVMSIDEFEALRLADYLGLEQQPAAELMNISRPTFTRLLGSARKKMAQMVVDGKKLCIEGGRIELRRHRCRFCGREWQKPSGFCPTCGEKHQPGFSGKINQ